MVAEGRKDVCMKAIRKIGVCVCLCGLVATAFAAKLSKSVPRGWNEDFAASCETATPKSTGAWAYPDSGATITPRRATRSFGELRLKSAMLCGRGVPVYRKGT